MLLGIYQTSNVVNIIQENDIIMQQIKDKKNKFVIAPVNAEINENEIIPGMYGINIDYKKSYSNMKKYGSYNEALTVLKEDKPDKSIEDTYNKYITRGNPNNRNIALIFKIDNTNSFIDLLTILNKKEIQSTFFIDGKILEKNVNLIKKIKNHELEILNYNNSYDEALLKTSFSYLEAITGKKTKYCYTEKENQHLLDICSKQKKHTIKQDKYINEDLYKYIKNNLTNSSIYTIDKYTQEELYATIDYIKSKGYNIVTLECLLSEKVC